MFSTEINTYYGYGTGGTLCWGMLSVEGHIVLALRPRKGNLNYNDESLIWAEDKTAWKRRPKGRI